MLKMMVISKKINADYSQIANQLINFIVYFLLLSPERVHEFIKCGGAKRLKSLPKGMVLEDNERQIGLILETMAQTSF